MARINRRLLAPDLETANNNKLHEPDTAAFVVDYPKPSN